MSRSKEDWIQARDEAVKIRGLMHEIMDLLSEWPVGFDESYAQRVLIDAEMEECVVYINAVIGMCQPEWVFEK